MLEYHLYANGSFQNINEYIFLQQCDILYQKSTFLTRTEWRIDALDMNALGVSTTMEQILVFTKREKNILRIAVLVCPNAMKIHHVVVLNVDQINLCLMEQFCKVIAAGGGEENVRQQQNSQPTPQTIYGHARNYVSLEISKIY